MLRNMRLKLPISAYPWFMVACGMLFYCYNYFLRSGPSVIQNELSQSLHITAYQFGFLTSAYYWAYTPMQIPAGMIYDKFGVRVVLGFACLVGVLGLHFFLNADTYTVAWLGRFMIGIGCAFAYIGTLKLAATWLPDNLFATAAGLATAAGMTSGALTQRYISHAVQVTGNYQFAMHSGLVIGILLSIIIFIFVRDMPKTSTKAKPPSMDIRTLLTTVKTIFKNPQMWLIGAIGCLLYLPASVFLDAYCKEFLVTVYGISGRDAVNIANITFLGWIVSGPIIGAYSDRIKRRRMPLILSSSFAAAMLCIVFYMPHMFSLYGLYVAFFLTGISCGGHPLCFSLGRENYPENVSGTAIATTNAFIMLGGMLFPPLVGELLDLHSTAIGIGGLPIHDASDYIFALSVIPIGVATGIILSLFVKETYCEMPPVETASMPELATEVATTR